MTYDHWKCSEPSYMEELPEPDCDVCDDQGYFYGSYGEIIYCDCETIPYWERDGGYGLDSGLIVPNLFPDSDDISF